MELQASIREKWRFVKCDFSRWIVLRFDRVGERAYNELTTGYLYA
jgi:hypothetical protein